MKNGKTAFLFPLLFSLFSRKVHNPPALPSLLCFLSGRKFPFAFPWLSPQGKLLPESIRTKPKPSPPFPSWFKFWNFFNHGKSSFEKALMFVFFVAPVDDTKNPCSSYSLTSLLLNDNDFLCANLKFYSDKNFSAR
ncbi:hypothetical protein SAMN05421768_11237 [Chryseobacterium joostei]|uniref:Uncharacterized protein n=1 Tax=Chryseobacterium joostei TaxID=112234 RepID=A0A1N7KHG0_9FLAO|nr:hypothetical protein SAMN05421768_11237 [Chryseobacterium joostei]